MRTTSRDISRAFRKEKHRIPLCCKLEFYLTIWLGRPRHSIDVGCFPRCPHMHCWFHRKAH